MTQAFALSFNDAPIFARSWKGLGTWALIVLLTVTIILAGCGFPDFTSAAEADVPVVIQMITNITNVVAPGVSAPIQAAGALALAALVILCGNVVSGASKCLPDSLIGQYMSAPTATVLQKIDAALVAVNVHVNDLIALAKGLPQSVGAAIVAAVGIALQVVTSLMALVPVGSAMLLGNRKLAKTLLKASSIPKPGSVKNAFNAAIGGRYPLAVIR